MNQAQLKYARDRIKKIYDQKAKDITARHTTPAKTLSNEEKFEALKRGAFTVKKRENNFSGGMWYNQIDFGETFAITDVDARNKDLANLNGIFDRLMDELILGDNEKALEMLKEFENIVV